MENDNKKNQGKIQCTDVKIGRKYMKKLQQNLGSTKIEKVDDMKDCVNRTYMESNKTRSD